MLTIEIKRSTADRAFGQILYYQITFQQNSHISRSGIEILSKGKWLYVSVFNPYLPSLLHDTLGKLVRIRFNTATEAALMFIARSVDN